MNYQIVLENTLKNLKEKKTLLYLPTYGENGTINDVLPVINKIKDKYKLVIKWHHGTDYLKEEKEIVLNAERNSFQLAEIKHFFDIIDGKIENDSDVRHAYQVLKLTRGII